MMRPYFARTIEVHDGWQRRLHGAFTLICLAILAIPGAVAFVVIALYAIMPKYIDLLGELAELSLYRIRHGKKGKNP